MTQDKRNSSNQRGGRPGGGPGGGDRRGGRPNGGRRGRPGGPGRGPEKPQRVETYEDVKLLTRGAGFRIEKSVVAEKGTHKAVRTQYRLYREGLSDYQGFERLADAQAAATAPLPEPAAAAEEPEASAAEAEPPPTESSSS